MNATTPLNPADLVALERDSWIDSVTADAFGLYRVTHAEGAELVGRTDREDYAGIVFPTYWPGEMQSREYFLRRDHPSMEQRGDGTLKPRQKYLAPPGRSNRLLFGPGEPADVLADTSLPILLVEGLKKVCAAWRLSRLDGNAMRFLACGLTGVWNFRGTIGKATDATGARVDVKGIIPDFDRVTWAGRKVVVLYDSDTASNPKVLAARRGLVEEFRARGACVTAPDLPVLIGIEKPGIDDLLAYWGPAKVLEWLESAADAPEYKQDAEIVRLAALSTIDYGRARKAAAKRLGVAVSFVDAAVAFKQKDRAAKDNGHGQALEFEEIVPAFEPVDGDNLGSRLAALFTRYAVLPLHGDTVLVLWTLFTYCLDLFAIAPRLDISSPEKGCGKTTVLSLLRRVAFRSVLASGITPSAIFRVIAAHTPTLLIDEMDTFIEANEELRGILNSGHTKDAARIIRCVGDAHEPKAFSTWAAMAFGHIGKIPDTLEDRSVRLPMRRKLPGERVTSLRQTGPAGLAVQTEFDDLQRQMTRWVADHTSAIASANPPTVDGLSDRALDNWMPLLAIADILGGTWPDQARQAAVALSGQATVDDGSIKVQLLTDIHALYTQDGVDRFASADLCNRLILLEERPWGSWKHGKPLTPTQLSRLLKPFGVSSRTVRIEGQGTPRGYLIEDFSDAFSRYLPSRSQYSTLSKCNSATTHSQSGDSTLFQGATDDSCCTSENGLNPAPSTGCVTVALQNPQNEREEVIDLVD